jgi:hypothetical protein
MRNIPMDAGGVIEDFPRIAPVANATKPYWRTEPHPLDSHRTTPELPSECDIAIVGAGMSGVATAYHMSKLWAVKQPSILILEARQVCSGATGRNGVGVAKYK